MCKRRSASTPQPGRARPASSAGGRNRNTETKPPSISSDENAVPSGASRTVHSASHNLEHNPPTQEIHRRGTRLIQHISSVLHGRPSSSWWFIVIVAALPCEVHADRLDWHAGAAVRGRARAGQGEKWQPKGKGMKGPTAWERRPGATRPFLSLLWQPCLPVRSAGLRQPDQAAVKTPCGTMARMRQSVWTGQGRDRDSDDCPRASKRPP